MRLPRLRRAPRPQRSDLWREQRVERHAPLMPVRVALAVTLTLATGSAAGLVALALSPLGRAILGAEQPTTAEALEIVKISLAVVAGIGGVVALVVAYRKQRVTEAGETREQAKHFHERFTTASGQLGNDSPAVRLAGVHALSALADDWEGGRQMCIDVLCAYLRMPPGPEPDATTDAAEHTVWLGMGEVRATIWRLIATHLKAYARIPWHGADLDFTGVPIAQDIDFSNTVFPAGIVRFNGATFSGGEVWFDGATFSGGQVRFSRATFSGGKVRFGHATFSGGKVGFDHATFSGGHIWFGDAAFSGGEVSFGGATFSGSEVWFQNATFSDSQVRFDHATFSGGKAWFGGAAISGGEVWFHSATFSGGEVGFGGATFSGGKVGFGRATFSGGQVGFGNVTFSGSQVWFHNATFFGGEIGFDGATFSGGQVGFGRATFSGGQVGFVGATFCGSRVGFVGARFSGGQVRFDGVADWSHPPDGLPDKAPGLRLPPASAPDPAPDA
ncbi:MULTISPECIES: pentapeptide repeat-containing protein [unclassified Nonomuraea]|uniref:pentapeptide repeat-containing protein n=1 Tax=unclassified Nonomuraea TaxID=2593643 RepID=UPI0033FD9DD5